MEDSIRKFALQNALEHGGKAAKGAVMSRVLGERPELRLRAAEVGAALDRILTSVNAMEPAAQRAALEALAPELLEAKKAERAHGLPPLEGAVPGGVVMRFAPGPSGPLHIGHSRAAILNDEYCRMYRGRYILRLEDTDPARVRPDAYEMIKQDMAWMDCKVDEVVVQSDRFERYYEVARRLLELGKAYVCTDDEVAWRELKLKSRPCPHRHQHPEKNIQAFEAMIAGAFKPGEAVVIGQTDLDHPNPAVRDFPLLRIEDTPHPQTGTRYRVYPLMNFSVTVDDHDLGLTHVLRGKDHLNNTLRQGYLFSHLAWKVPVYIHYGRVRIEGPELSTSKMDAGIRQGLYTGWDDVRLGTIRALARRGYRPQTLREYWVDASVKEVDIQLAWDNLNAIDKKRADPEACRLFFVEDPLEVVLSGLPSDLKAAPPRLPSRPEAGRRSLVVSKPRDAAARALVPRKEFERLTPGSVFRLKDLANLRREEGPRASFMGIDVAAAKGAPILHWLPCDPEQTAVARLLRPDGSAAAGRIERAALLEDRRVVQLERVGFARLEAAGSPTAEVAAYYLYR